LEGPAQKQKKDDHKIEQTQITSKIKYIYFILSSTLTKRIIVSLGTERSHWPTGLQGVQMHQRLVKA